MHMAEENTVNLSAQNTIMTFPQFIQEIKARMQEFFPDADTRVVSVEKNNGLILTGLSIMEPGRRVTPNIYLNDAYQSYTGGVALAQTAAEVADLYRENRLEEEPEIPDITNFDAIKDIICCRLVNRERNRERLGKMPHRDFLDLAIVYYIPVNVKLGGECKASITMMDAHAAKWAVDSDTLFSTARANTERIFPSELQSMGKILQDLCPGLSVQETGMHILRNNGSSGGAAALLNAEILREFAGRHGDFYIFPSSVHEVILHPVAMPGMVLEKEDVSSMVRDVNQAQVAPDEVLSDHAYYYHADTGEIEILS